MALNAVARRQRNTSSQQMHLISLEVLNGSQCSVARRQRNTSSQQMHLISLELLHGLIAVRRP